jgi:hypothetical protein
MEMPAQIDASCEHLLSCQLKAWIELLLRNNSMAIDIIQVANVSDAVDILCAVSERDTESLTSVTSLQSTNATAEPEIIEVLSHVPQLRNPHILTNCAALLAQHDDGLG